MIQTVYSNSYELLRRVLVNFVLADRKARLSETGVFSQDTIVIASEAVKDDVMRAFADEQGICSGLSTPSFYEWFSASVGTMMGTAHSGQEMLWMICSLLNDEEFLSRPECKRLRDSVKEQSPAGLMALARRIKSVFSVYVSYRLDWVLEWMHPEKANDKKNLRYAREAQILQKHPDFSWQKALWQEFAQPRWGDGGTLWYGVHALESIESRWRAAMTDSPGVKEKPLHMFLPQALPPLALPFLQAMSRHRDVFLYLFNPCENYWFESIPPTLFKDWKRNDESAALQYLRRNAAAQRALIERVWTFAGDPETDPTIVEDDAKERKGDGTVGRSVTTTPEHLNLSELHLLRAADAAPQEQTSLFVRHPDPHTVLEHLQNAILTDSRDALPSEVDPDDDSFLIVKAPTAAREIEAVLDWFDSLIQKSASTESPIGAQDVLVVTPDIDALAPVISAVIMNRPADKRMMYHIAGQSQISVNGNVQALLAVVRFVFSAGEREDFEALLDYPVIFRSWNQTESCAEIVRKWLVAAGYRWGFDQEHVDRCLIEDPERSEGGDVDGTLERAMERIALGMRLGDERKEPFAETMPVRGTELGGFDTVAENKPVYDFLCSFAMTLIEQSKSLHEQTPREWVKWSHAFVEKIMPQAAQEPEIARLLVEISHVAQAAENVFGEKKISFDAFWSSVTNNMQEQKTLSRACGRITFAGMENFRWLPYRAIAVVGLNDGPTFPGVTRSEEFDLMVAEITDEKGRVLSTRRRGDRDSRQSNRNVFLDIVCACREHLLISYCSGIGQTEKNPSVVLQDLKATLALGLGSDDIVEKRLTVKLPASTYGVPNFDPERREVVSRSRVRYEALQKAIPKNFLAPQPWFLAGTTLANPQGTSHALSIKALNTALFDADRWTARELTLDVSDAQDVEDVPFYADVDPLSMSVYRRDILKRLESGQSVLEILKAYELDPLNGVEALRKSTFANFVNTLSQAWELKKAFENRAKETIDLPECRFTDPTCAETDAFNEIYVGRRNAFLFDETTATVSICATKADRRRALLEFLTRSACGGETEAYLIDASGGNVSLYAWRCPADVQHSVKILHALLNDVNDHCAQPMTMASTSDRKPNAFNPLWLGADNLQEAVESSKKVQEVVSSIDEALNRPLADFECALLEECKILPGGDTDKTGKKSKAPTLQECVERLI